MIEVVSETHDTPDEIVRRVTAAGGLNVHGKPNFRVIWGGNLRDELGTPYEANAWHLERWIDEDPSWNHGGLISYVGYGRYEHSFCFGTRVTPTAAEYVVRGIVYGLENFTPYERMAALKRREEAAQEAWSKMASDLLEINESMPQEIQTGKGSGGYVA